MGNSDSATDRLENRRKRLIYRAHHRGTKELDMVLGAYADQVVDAMDGQALEGFEHLLDAPEPELYAWITGAIDVPEDYDTPLLAAIIAFQRAGGAVQER